MNDQQREEMFKVWRDFQHIFKDGSAWKIEDNYYLQEAIEQWANEQPKGSVDIVGCDDSYHSSSDLVLFHHIWADDQGEKQWWGTTCVFIAQCDGQPPSEFHLYPRHAKALIDSLSNVWKVREWR